MNQPRNFCQYCGTPLSANVRFCEACGQPVPGGSPSSSDETVISPAPMDFSRSQDAPADVEPEQPPTVVHQPPVVPPPVKTQPPVTPPPPRISTPPPYTPPPPPATPPQTPRRPWWVYAIVAVVILCCLCVAAAAAGYYFFSISPSQVTTEVPAAELPAPEETSIPVETVEVTVQVPIVEAGPGSPEETEVVEATQPPATPEETPTISFRGISFSFGPEIASAADGQVVQAVTGSDVPPWELAPRHARFTFSDYPLQDTFHQPQLIVYPVEEYAQLSEGVSTLVGDLRALLVDRSVNVPEKGLPFLPVWNAAQMMQTYINYLDFKNGSGIRYITQYGQAAYPINSQSMFYTFQGLTDDGLYYVTAIFPISNPVLPSPDSVELNDAFFDGFTTYIDETEALLDNEPTANFTPDVSLLDDLITSLEITP